MSVLVVIPVRMGSSRFPGKPLKKIKDKSMVTHIYDNVYKSKLSTDIVIATCDKEIFDHAKLKNKNVVMTSKKHKRATERTAEALKICEKRYKKKFSIVVMVQGDEPMVTSKMIDKSIKPFKNKSVNVVNLISRIKKKADFTDPNCIKVIKDKNYNAIYFSRKPIPTKKLSKENYGYKQVCVIPFRRKFLLKYIKMKPSSLEISESIDMLRLLENDLKIRLVEIYHETYPVDTKKDLIKVNKILNKKII